MTEHWSAPLYRECDALVEEGAPCPECGEPVVKVLKGGREHNYCDSVLPACLDCSWVYMIEVRKNALNSKKHGKYAMLFSANSFGYRNLREDLVECDKWGNMFARGKVILTDLPFGTHCLAYTTPLKLEWQPDEDPWMQEKRDRLTNWNALARGEL